MTQLAASQEYQDWDPEVARQTARRFASRPGALIEAMHRLQALFGYLPDDSIAILADEFNLSRADVYGTASFYHDFKRSKPGRYTVKVCQAEACQAMGSEKLTNEIKDFLGAGFHETSADGNFSLEPVYCLGNCACSPNIMVEKQVYARMSIDKFKSLAETLAKEDK